MTAAALAPQTSRHGHRFAFECRDRFGNLKWSDGFDNALTNEGLDDILSKYYKGSSYTAAHYCGLVNTGATLANADTMASHSGWTEVTSYDEATRPAVTWGSVSGQSVSNSASKATFTISATVTLYGAFLATNSTKGGTTGVLLGHGAFSTPRSLADDDVLTVTVTATAARG